MPLSHFQASNSDESSICEYPFVYLIQEQRQDMFMRLHM